MDNFKLLKEINLIKDELEKKNQEIISLKMKYDIMEEKLNNINFQLEEKTLQIETLTTFRENTIKLLLSSKPIKSIYNTFPTSPLWVRIYHTDENWLNEHNKIKASKFTGEVIGFALTQNPHDIL